MDDWPAELEAAEAERAAALAERVEELKVLLEQKALNFPRENWEERAAELLSLSIDDAARVERLYKAAEAGGVEAVELGDVIRRKLRSLRVAAGSTQREVAEHMRREGFGWQRITVAETESGRRRPTLEELLELAEHFDVDLVTIFTAFEPGESCRLNPSKAISASEARTRIRAIGLDPGDWR